MIAYRKLRLLELAIIEELKSADQQLLDVGEYIKVNVNQFYGIELEEFPAQIAQTALWLMDHQMNSLVGSRFGQYFARIPLVNSASIVQGNALALDWETIIPKHNLSYILGNPPHILSAGTVLMSLSIIKYAGVYGSEIVRLISLEKCRIHCSVLKTSVHSDR